MSNVIKTSVSFAPSVHDAMKQRQPQLSSAIDTNLKRYLYALWDARRRLAPQFSDQECGLILDTLNGTIFYPFSVKLLPAEIQDAIALDQLDQKWEIDGPGLVKKLEALDYFQCLAVVDAAEAWWNRTSEDPQPGFGELFTGHPDNKVVNELQS